MARRGQSDTLHSRVTNGSDSRRVDAKARHSVSSLTMPGSQATRGRLVGDSNNYCNWSDVATQSILQTNNVIEDQGSAIGAHGLNGPPIAPARIQVLVSGSVA